MSDIQIKHELGKYYVTVKYETNPEEEYLVRMITENRINGHLPCRISYEGMEKYLMYDVTNMISFKNEYENKYIEIDVLKNLFESISKIYVVGGGHLLEETYYYIDPQYIYRDMSTDELQLLYIPGLTHNEKNRYYKLADFLLQRINRRDDSCVQIAYQFYRMSGADTFSISMFLNVIEKETIMHKRTAISNTEKEQEDIDRPDISSISTLNTEEVVLEWKRPLICSIVAIAYELAYLFIIKNTYYDVYGMVLAIILFVVVVSVWVKSVYLYITEIREENIEMPELPVTVDQYWGDEETEVLQDNTVVINEQREFEQGYRLEWKVDGSSKQYKINSFPVIIGKMAGEVDCLIDDASISRLHAKIVRRNNEICIFDLNSTNGTFCDGAKLLPGQEVRVYEDSKIMLGNIIIRLAY